MALAAAAILSAAAAKNNDPVVMTINGKDVRQSEFEYLYKKNNLQQLQPQTVDEYVDMFVVYKLKVADAEAAGIDTTSTFRKEFEGYCAELARPYFRDSLVETRLVNEAYARMATSRLVSHIMLPLGTTIEEREANRNRLDSIRGLVLNGADFGEMAIKYSSDRSALRNKGSMGYINVNSYPYPFEYAAYATPVGEVSEVFEDAPYGFHIVKVMDEKTNPGKVEARHILKLTQGMSEEEAGLQKARIDSIYSLLKSGGDFDAIARAESEDPGSAANGGRLPLFGPNEMVPEFEEAAFSLNDGEISAPFATAYGYHIVQTLSHKGIGTLEEERASIMAAISRDMRSSMPETERLNQLKRQYRAVVSPEGLESVKAVIKKHETSAAALAALASSNITVGSIGETKIAASEVIASIPQNLMDHSKDAFTTFSEGTTQLLNTRTIEHARKQLAVEDADYRNLINEYRDGILLFEISNNNVWERSTKDSEGLEAYFKANRDKYTWDMPRYKGYVIFSTSDSIASDAKQYLANNKVETDSLVKTLRGRYGRNIKIERVIAAKGDNPVIDHIAFNAERPKASGKWIEWFAYQGRIIDAPEEAADVRGAVATDYQQQLERNWVTDLRNKYSVKLNKKALKKITE